MPARDVRALYKIGLAICKTSIPTDFAQAIVPAPSTTAIPMRLAESLARHLGPSARVYDVLRKPTIAEVLAVAPTVKEVQGKHVEDYKSTLARLKRENGNKNFSLKYVPTQIRSHFISVKLRGDAKIPHRRSVIVVDDILATGTTIRDSASALREYFKPTLISGFTMLGKL